MLKQSRVYKGIEYVQLSELPIDQQNLIAQSSLIEFIIKIQVDGKILNDCIQFKDYEDWYIQTFNDRQLRTIRTQELGNVNKTTVVNELVVEKV